MRLMISGGGTGGHVYPALAVAQILRGAGPAQSLNQPETKPQLLWVGSQGGMEQRLVAQAEIDFQTIATGGLRGKNPFSFIKGILKLGRGYLQSRHLLAHYQPDILFITGGYVCVPITLAAYQQDIPILIYLPDLEPGQAIKFLSRYANKVAVTSEKTQAFFPPDLTVVTGYPVRERLYQLDKTTAQTQLRLDPSWPTLLVCGGSQGARQINKAITAPKTLEALLKQAQVIHISGSLDLDWVKDIQADLPEPLKARYHLYGYLDQMPEALVAADLILCRAGASTLGELPAVGGPSILVPYPHSGAHQWANAQYLADKGAAIVIPESALDKQLSGTSLSLLKDAETRRRMGTAAKALARPDAAFQIANQLRRLSKSV